MLIFVQLAAYPLVTVVWVKLWVSDILWDILYFVPDLVFLASQVSDQNCLNWPVQSLIDHPSLVMPNIEHNLVQYLPQSFWSLFLAPSSGEPVSKLPQKSNELNKKSFKLMLKVALSSFQMRGNQSKSVFFQQFEIASQHNRWFEIINLKWMRENFPRLRYWWHNRFVTNIAIFLDIYHQQRVLGKSIVARNFSEKTNGLFSFRLSWLSSHGSTIILRIFDL